MVLVMLKTLAHPHTVKLLTLKLKSETTEKMTQAAPNKYCDVQNTLLSTLFLVTLSKKVKFG